MFLFVLSGLSAHSECNQVVETIRGKKKWTGEKWTSNCFLGNSRGQNGINVFFLGWKLRHFLKCWNFSKAAQT